MYHPFLKELMMKSIFAALAFSIPIIATAQVYSGPCPGGCTPAEPVEQPAPARKVCYGSYGCMVASYTQSGLFTVATVTLPNGYPVAGISGACLPGWDCPGIRDDADRDLVARLDDLQRFQRFLGQ